MYPSQVGGDVNMTRNVAWIMGRDLNRSIREVLKAGEKLAEEGVAEEQAKGGTLDYMCMQLEWDVADLHLEGLSAT